MFLILTQYESMVHNEKYIVSVILIYFFNYKSEHLIDSTRAINTSRKHNVDRRCYVK